MVGGVIAIGVVLLLSIVATILSLRAKTWQRLALNNKIESQSSTSPETLVKVGAKGVALSRISPMGKVRIDGKEYEAKSDGTYIDQRSEVEVVGFENFTVIVKKM